MNIAVVTAGGSGKRTGQDVPKQFLTVYDTPIIIYTLRNLQRSADIDKIIVVVPEGWDSFVDSYANQYNITKLFRIIHGGATRHESISNAVHCAAQAFSADDILLLVDANRPMIPADVFASSVKAVEKGSAVLAVENCFDSIFYSRDGIHVDEERDRSVLYKGQTPESAYISDWIEVYDRADRDGEDTLPTSALFLKYQKNVVIVKGSAKSFKITTVEDIEIFKALLKAVPGSIPENTLK